MDHNTSFNLSIPTRIYCGLNQTKILPELCQRFGSNLLLVTSKDLDHIKNRIFSYFSSSQLTLDTFYIESPEPTCKFIDISANQLRTKQQYDCIIGLGGGSAIDMAKSLSIALTQPENIWSYADLSNRPASPLANDVIPVIGIPTTSGTGSEVTPYAVLTESCTSQKGTIQEVAVFPRVAIIDPLLTMGMPKELTASTGIDAFAHAFESYINISKESPVSEWAGTEAMRLIFHYLIAAYNEPDNIEARLNMAWASTLAGIAIAHRGTTTAHAIAEPLGALTKLPHSLSVAISTLPVLKYTWKSIISKLANLYKRINIGYPLGKEDEYYAYAFVEELVVIFEKVDMNKKASDYLSEEKTKGLTGKLLENILEYKFRPFKQHPLHFSSEQLFDIIDEVIHG